MTSELPLRSLHHLPRKGTETSIICFSLCNTGKQCSLHHLPRKGTETVVTLDIVSFLIFVVHCIIYPARGRKRQNFAILFNSNLEFTASFTPQGDGNLTTLWLRLCVFLCLCSLHHLPRKGTETMLPFTKMLTP